MNIRSVYFLFIVSFSMISCDKQESMESEANISNEAAQRTLAVIDDVPTVKNYIIYTVTKRATLPGYVDGTGNGVSVLANFYDASGNAVSVGTIRAGNYSVSAAANNVYSYASDLEGNTSSRRAEGRVMDDTGQDIVVSADGGNGYGGFSETVHVPADFNLVASAYDNFVFGRALRLDWNPDPGNAFGNVLINVSDYSGSGSALHYLLPDNGSFTVPAESMARFPVGSRFSYSIAKVNEYEVDPVNDIMIYTLVETASVALTVVPSPGIYVRLEQDGSRSSGSSLEKLIEVNQTLRFYQDAACTIPVQIWSDITVYKHILYSENGVVSEWNDEIPVAKGSSSLNLGWQPLNYSNRRTGEGWFYQYSLPERMNYNSVN